MNTIGRLLYAYRKTNNLTQKELVENLSHFSSDFDGLSTVTLSRWETGTTNPGIKKKQKLLKILFSEGCSENEECHSIIKESYRHLQKALEETFSNYYKHMVGNFPEPRNATYAISNLKDHTDKQKLLEQIIHIEDAMCAEGYYTLSPQCLDAWCSYPGSFAVVCEKDGQHLGHYILLKVKNHVAEDIAFRKRSYFSLMKDDFCDAKEKGTYCSFAFYARSSKVAALLNVQHYLYLFENSRFIDNILLFSTRDDIVPLMKNYGIKTVASGKDQTYNVNWYGMLSPVEDIFFSDALIKAVF